VQFTSGTTGRPKGALHRHGDPAAYYRSVAIPVVEIDRPDVTLSISKLFFAYGFGNALVFPLFSGSAAVLIAGAPTPQAVQELAVRHRVSVLYAVPSAYANLVAEASPEAFGSVRVAVSAGESLAIGLGERASALLGAPVLDQLGSTEAGHAFCSNTLAGNVPGTIGTPLPGYQLELRDADGNVLGEESDGALWLRGPTLMSQYLNLPEATAEVLVDGWLRTADRAVRHPDQTYTHIGRTDDMEMVGGITVAPLEIERVLSEHADVSEVAVAAVPDERGATKLLAFVVTYRADRPRPELEAELTALARARLARYKVPRAVRFVDALPRTPTGKLRRFIVRQGSW
jgi:acyl-coenzyme A synthetase/AMP-(fatty) acid ligase